MSSTEDEKERVVRAMAARTVNEVKGLNWFNDFDLITVLMGAAYDNGFVYDQLEKFRSDGNHTCFGFFRDAHHYAGMVRVWGWQSYSAIMVESTGEFGGVWFFVIDTDHTVGTSRDGQPVDSFNGLEAGDLIRAVVCDALTRDLPPEPVRTRRRWWPFS